MTILGFCTKPVILHLNENEKSEFTQGQSASLASCTVLKMCLVINREMLKCYMKTHFNYTTQEPART